jgi:hypothetical protein
MDNKFKLALVIVSVTFLAACGGGGSSSGGSTAGNPLQKYEGTYSICDVGGHSKQTVTVTANGSNSVNMASVEQIYQNTNCSGAIVGTYSLPSPITATYQSQTTASFPQVTIMPRSDIVESVTISAPAMTAILVGSGVSGSCVTYATGNQCFNNLSMAAQAFTAAFYLRGNYFVTFDRQNGVLVANGIFSKDPSFNYNMLIPN